MKCAASFHAARGAGHFPLRRRGKFLAKHPTKMNAANINKPVALVRRLGSKCSKSRTSARDCVYDRAVIRSEYGVILQVSNLAIV